MAGAGGQQDPGTGVRRGPGGQHVVDQYHPCPLHPDRPAGRQVKGAPDIAAALVGPQAGL